MRTETQALDAIMEDAKALKYVLVLVDNDCAPEVFGPFDTEEEARRVAEEDGHTPETYRVVPLVSINP